jgi:hypothetical protein
MNRRRNRRCGADHPELAKEPLFAIRESGALPRSPAAPRDRDAADDAEIELRHVLESERLAMLHEPLRGGGGLEVHALCGQLVGIDAQIGNRQEQELAVVERAQADVDLRRIGIALDHASAAPFIEFAQPLRRDIRANEIRDAVEKRGRR